MGLSTGTQLGPFQILSATGAGGMGEVYKASDTRLDRMVAIKILSAHLAAALNCGSVLSGKHGLSPR
jgi:hypothetical protein